MIEKNTYIDAVRGVAILGVVLIHTANQVKSNSAGSELLLYFLVWGRFGVELFFLVSGFLMRMIYQPGVSSRRWFLVSRFSRLWPLWMLASVFWYFAHSLGWSQNYLQFEGEELDKALVLSAFFLNFLNPEIARSFLPGSWSIVLEVFLYCVFAVLINSKIQSLVATAIAINGATILAKVLGANADGLIAQAGHAISELSPSSGVNYFVAGAVLYELTTPHEHRSYFIFRRDYKEIAPRAWGLWLVSWLLSPAYFGSHLEAIAWIGCVVFLSSLFGNRTLRILAFFGSLSYGIFVYHFVTILFLVAVFNPSAETAPSLFGWLVNFFVSYMVVLAISTGLSWLSLNIFERPCQKFIRKSFARLQRSSRDL